VFAYPLGQLAGSAGAATGITIFILLQLRMAGPSLASHPPQPGTIPRAGFRERRSSLPLVRGLRQTGTAAKGVPA
jgi:hypothetical protein